MGQLVYNGSSYPFQWFRTDDFYSVRLPRQPVPNPLVPPSTLLSLRPSQPLPPSDPPRTFMARKLLRLPLLKRGE